MTIKENTWNDILQKYEHNSSIKHTRKPNSLKKVVISIIAATISLLGISTVVCNANGINLFNIFFNKNTGVASTNQNVSVNTIQDAYYDNLKTFLSEHTEVILPSYLPNEYIFDNSTYHLDDTKKEYSTVFSNSNNIIRVIQTTYLNEELLPYTNYEVDGTLIEEYYYNQITFNIYSNKDRFTAIWIIDNTSYTINTSVTIDELKNIINSMYKGEN